MNLKNPSPKKVLSFQGKIHLICNDEELAEAREILLQATELGFDTETRPSYVKGQVFKVALLQLSTENDAFLIRLHKLKSFETIVKIFENPKTPKAGVAIHDDLKALKKSFAFEPKGFVELQKMAKDQGLKRFGLKSMAEDVLGGTVFKGPKMTNWERSHLTEPQRLYAATDAWIGLKLYHQIPHWKPGQ